MISIIRLDDQFRFDRLPSALALLFVSVVAIVVGPWKLPGAEVALGSLILVTGILFVHQFGSRGAPLVLGFLTAGIVLSLLIWANLRPRGLYIAVGGALSAALIVLYSNWIEKQRIAREHRFVAESEMVTEAGLAKTGVEELSRKLEREEVRLKTWASLVDIVRGCSSTLKLEGLASFVLASVESLFPGDRVSLWIKGAGTAQPDGLDRLALERKQNILVLDQSTDYRLQGRPEYCFSGKSALVCPLMEDNDVYGNLRVTSDESERFSHEDMVILSHIAAVVSMSAINVRLYERTEELALKDGQTGLFKRYHFEKRYSEECKRAVRNSTALALILFDIDHFKRVNDTYGHALGDQVLMRVGKMILQVNWGGPIPCRWGGEEFLLALPDATPNQARARASAVMESIKAQHFKAADESGDSFVVTVSAGLAVFPGDTGDPEHLFQICDRRMYAAKNSGRDRLVDHD